MKWRVGTVTEVIEESSTARTLVLDVPGWPGHEAGQHADIRLTADDGYQASRSYSLATAPGEQPAVTVQKVEDGEVSTYLAEVVEVGDRVELLGPVGGYFVWRQHASDLLLIGGGSGIVPLRSMWRHRTPESVVQLLYSAQTVDRLIYADEIAALDFPVSVHLTRENAEGYAHGRIDAASIAAAIRSPETDVYICGPTEFVEAVAVTALEAGVAPERIRTERFG